MKQRIDFINLKTIFILSNEYNKFTQKGLNSTPLAFQAGTAENLNMTASKLNKHKIAIIWWWWGLYR